MIDLQILETIEKLQRREEMEMFEEEEEQQEIANQVFPSHETINERFCKTLYYGRLPATDRTSLPLTQLAVERFTGVGLDKLGRLDMSRASDISRNACASPTSLVLALLYLDRLRRHNPDYLNTVTSADLFLVSLLVANKFLHDDGEEDEVFNDEWASSGGIDTKELNRLELGFLSAMDWRIYVDNDQFASALRRVETDIAFKEVSSRGWASYTDLDLLTTTTTVRRVWSLLAECCLKVTTVCMTAYAASLLTLLGTVSVLSQTPVGPANVASSASTLASSWRQPTPRQDSASPDLPGTSAAEFLTASLLVATLTSGAATADLEEEDEGRLGMTGGGRNASVEEEETGDVMTSWLAEYSDDDPEDRGNVTNWENVPPDLPIDHTQVWLREQYEFIRHSTTTKFLQNNNRQPHGRVDPIPEVGPPSVRDSLNRDLTTALKNDLVLDLAGCHTDLVGCHTDLAGCQTDLVAYPKCHRPRWGQPWLFLASGVS